MPKLLMGLLRFLLFGLVFLVGGLAVIWTAGALYFDLPAPALLRTIAAIGWTLAAALFGDFLWLAGKDWRSLGLSSDSRMVGYLDPSPGSRLATTSSKIGLRHA